MTYQINHLHCTLVAAIHMVGSTVCNQCPTANETPTQGFTCLNSRMNVHTLTGAIANTTPAASSAWRARTIACTYRAHGLHGFVTPNTPGQKATMATYSSIGNVDTMRNACSGYST